MSTYLNATPYGIFIAPNDLYARNAIREFTAQLTAAGFVQTSDTGQLSLNSATGWYDLPLSTTPWSIPITTNSPTNIFDGNTGTTCTFASSTPSVANPTGVYFDGGLGASNTAATYKIWFANAAGDPKTWLLQGSNDLLTWTLLDTQTGISPGSSGYQTYTIGSPAAFRYYRLYITALSSGTNTVMTEWQLINAGSTNFAAGAASLFTSTSTAAQSMGFQVWRFADTLQGTAPCYFKIAYNIITGSSGCIMGLVLTLGNSTNGAGTMTGTGVTAATTAVATSLANTSNGKTYYSYATNGSRFAFFFNGNQSGIGSCAALVLERTKDSTGADTSQGVCYLVITPSTSSNVSISQGVCRCDGVASIAAETVIGIVSPNTSSQARAGQLGVNECSCFIGGRLNPMVGVVGYKNGDMTAQVPFNVSVYGSTHTYLPTGVASALLARSGNSSDALAIQWE